MSAESGWYQKADMTRSGLTLANLGRLDLCESSIHRLLVLLGKTHLDTPVSGVSVYRSDVGVQPVCAVGHHRVPVRIAVFQLERFVQFFL